MAPTLAEMMARARRKRLFTQEDAAEASGIPLTSWQRYESGRGLPSAYNARALATWMQIEIDQIAACLRNGSGEDHSDDGGDGNDGTA